MTHQELLELHVARKALEEHLKDAGPLKAGKYELSDVRVLVSVREASVTRNADGLATPTPKINWLLMCAYLLAKASDLEGTKKKLMAFAAKTLASGQPGPIEAVAAELEEEFEGIKAEARKKLKPEHRTGATVVKALGTEAKTGYAAAEFRPQMAKTG